MKYVSDSNLSRFFQKLKGIFAKKSEVPSQADLDARYLQLSGGTLTGNVILPAASGVGLQSHDGQTVFQVNSDTSGVRIGSDYRQSGSVYIITGTSGHVYRYKNGTNNEILDKSMGLPYTTTAPTADNTDGIKIVVLSAEPSTYYNGYLYLIQGS